MNKAAIDSYLRNLLGQIIGAITIVIQTSGVASPLDFSGAEWLLVANALWASVIPVAIRWANKKDPAFGAIATVVASEVTKKLEKATTTKAKTTTSKPVVKKAVTTKKK
jgi:threonine/homoserine efflux transporter RhtA